MSERVNHAVLIEQARTVHKPKYPGAAKLVCEKCHVDYPCFIARLADELEHWHDYARHLKDRIIPEITEDLQAERDTARSDLVSAWAKLVLLAEGSPKDWMEYCAAAGLPLHDPDGNAVPDWWMRSIARSRAPRQPGPAGVER